MNKLLVLIGIVALTFAIGTPIVAAENVTDFGSEVPSVDDFTKALAPQYKTRSMSPQYKLRSIRPVDIPDPVPEILAEPVAVNISLTFELNSATLTTASKAILNNLGPALQGTQLSSYAFRIEGYTDASGEAKYNDWLSEERANSVQSYLVSNYGISTDRLPTMGKGETELADPKNPNSAKNRRVKIVNIGLNQ